MLVYDLYLENFFHSSKLPSKTDTKITELEKTSVYESHFGLGRRFTSVEYLLDRHPPPTEVIFCASWRALFREIL